MSTKLIIPSTSTHYITPNPLSSSNNHPPSHQPIRLRLHHNLPTRARLGPHNRQRQPTKRLARPRRKRRRIPWIPIIRRHNDTRTGHNLKHNLIVRHRHRVAPLIHNRNTDKRQIPSIPCNPRPVRRHIEPRRRADRAVRRAGPLGAVFVRYHVDLAGRVCHVVPAQARIVGPALLASGGFAVDEELGFVAGCEDVHGCYLAFAVGPGPVREDVGLGVVGAPARLVEVEAVFFEAGEVWGVLVCVFRGREEGGVVPMMPK